MGTRRLSSDHGEFTLFFTLNSPFSNFYPCNFEAEAIDKKVTFWNCVEHFYMYNKAVSCGNRQAADAIFPLNDAKRIKRIGAELIEVDKAEWAELSGSVMKTALKAKYSQNPDLRYLLFMTYGSRLVECSPQDRVWGIGLAIESDYATNPSRWRGENKLGKIMDEVRDEMWDDEQYIEERTKVEDGLGIPGFAAAYFDAKFPFTPTSFGVSTAEFTKDSDHSHSNKRSIQDNRNGSGRRSYSDRRRSPVSRRNHSRERRRDSDRGRKRSPFTPPNRRRSRRSPSSRSPVKKRSRRDRSSSTSSSGSSRTPSPGEWQKRNNNRRQMSPSPVHLDTANGDGMKEKPKTSADLIAEFLREHVQGVKPDTEGENVEVKEESEEKEERGPVLGPELPQLYKLEKSPEKEEKEIKMRRRESDSSPEGRRRSRSREKKRREESRRKRSRNRSKERGHKKTYRKSRSSARHRSSSKKGGSRRDDSRETEKRRSSHTSSRKEDGDKRKSKENRGSVEKKSKTPSKTAPPPAQKKEKTEEEKKKEMMMQKLMSGLLNKNKSQYLYQQYPQYPQY